MQIKHTMEFRIEKDTMGDVKVPSEILGSANGALQK